MQATSTPYIQSALCLNSSNLAQKFLVKFTIQMVYGNKVALGMF